MSIVAYTGLPGSGKSYSVVKHVILPALKKGRTVVTNVPLNRERIEALPDITGRVVDFPIDTVLAEPDRIREFVTNGCVWVVDEVWRLWPQGQNVAKIPEAFKSILAEHRHMVDAEGQEVYVALVTQDLSQIAAFARKLVEETFVTTKLSFVGLSGRYRVDVYTGGRTGTNCTTSGRIRQILGGKYEKETFALYKSHTLRTDTEQEGSNPDKLDGRANVFKQTGFVVGAVAVPVLIVGGIYLLRHSIHRATADGLMHGHAPQATSGADGTRSGAERPAASGGFAVRSRDDSPPPPAPRVLLEVGDPAHLEAATVYVSDGTRVQRISGSACRRTPPPGGIQCAFAGKLLDAAGEVQLPALARPLGSSGPSSKS